MSSRWSVLLAAIALAATLAGCGSSPATATLSAQTSTSNGTALATNPPAIPTPTDAAPASPSPSPAASPNPPPLASQLSVADVQAVVERTFPATSRGITGGCATGSCPFTARLGAQLAHLASQTPSPSHTGDVCNYDLMTGNQGGLVTPVAATVQLTAGGADAVVAGSGQSQPAVTLVVVDAGGTALVDDILYDINKGRSVYSLSCTGSYGG